MKIFAKVFLLPLIQDGLLSVLGLKKHWILIYQPSAPQRLLSVCANLSRRWAHMQTNILRKTIEGYLRLNSSIAFNKVKSKHITHALHSSRCMQSK